MPASVARVKYVCQTCDAPFYRRAKEALRHGPHKYCSMACRGQAMQRRVVLVCTECGDPFERALAEALRHRRDWCSWRCWRASAIRNAKPTSYPKIGRRHAHRIVGEQIAGRPLRRNEVVHHKDENRRNFSRDNLEVKTRAQHSREHNTGREFSLLHRLRLSVGVRRAKRGAR